MATIANGIYWAELLGIFGELANPTSEQIQSFKIRRMKSIQPALLNLTGKLERFSCDWVSLSHYDGCFVFFLYDGPADGALANEVSPLDDKYEKELLTEFDQIVRAIVWR